LKAMILAAGFGKRLGTKTRQAPKPMVQVGGQPLILNAIQLIQAAGIREVVVNLHYLGEKIEAFLGNGSRFGLNVQYSREPKILGTGGGVKKAQKLLGDDSFVLINSDIICKPDLKRVMAMHKASRAWATMVVRKDPKVSAYGLIGLNQKGRVTRILDIGEGFTRARMFTGIHVLSPKVFDFLKPRFSSIISDFYQKALVQRKNISGYDFTGFWSDAGTPAGFARSLDRFKKR